VKERLESSIFSPWSHFSYIQHNYINNDCVNICLLGFYPKYLCCLEPTMGMALLGITNILQTDVTHIAHRHIHFGSWMTPAFPYYFAIWLQIVLLHHIFRSSVSYTIRWYRYIFLNILCRLCLELLLQSDHGADNMTILVEILIIHRDKISMMDGV